MCRRKQPVSDQICMQWEGIKTKSFNKRSQHQLVKKKLLSCKSFCQRIYCIWVKVHNNQLQQSISAQNILAKPNITPGPNYNVADQHASIDDPGKY